ncbi:cytidylate kinase family protein [uncultured Phocaeicola sp.]|uniref:cytidylate kinase family protein n=1 Tax=uncultured Phocaeicola sp. TaxID=990718 RepID=UPI0025D132D1|nr:cytidylate kinase family protein [uncultured Phocaeicola sp.]
MKENRTMSKAELFRRYLTFGVSLFIIACGISIITRSNLGTSPITSVPYVASLNTPVSLGTYFFLFTVVLICMQLLLLGKKGILERKVELLMQFPVAFVLSLFTDLAMWMTSGFIPEMYGVKILSLVVGCMVLALGICLEVMADVTMISAEYTIQFATLRFKKDFGSIKICFDVTLVLIAIACSWALSGRIEGVREGTVIAALITGPFVRMIMPRLLPVRHWLSQPAAPEVVPLSGEEDQLPWVITISREYGSGGHQVGELLAKELDITFYDKELITLVAGESNFSEDFISQNEQRMPSALLYQMVLQDYEAPLDKSLSYEDALFVVQSRVIRRIASEGPCVIVGRCANYILKDRPHTLHVFLFADMPHKVERAVAEYGISMAQAPDVISRIDKSRKEHYFHYTGQLWGDSRNYNVTFDTGAISMSQVVAMIKEVYQSERG